MTASARIAQGESADQTLTRSAPCACGQAFEQAGYKIPFTDRVQWNPRRCPSCQARVQAFHAEVEEEGRRRSVEERRRQALAKLAVPPLYDQVSLETFVPHGSPGEQEQLRKIKDLAARYILSWPQIPERQELLLFQGEPGSGKGHIAWAIAQAIVSQFGARVRVVKLAAVIRDIRQAWRDHTGPSEDARLAHYRGLDLLVIDEVSRHAFYGKEVKQHLYDIVDDRLEQRRPTILTTNEGDEGVAEILGPALTSRLSGAGGKVPFPAVDWRARPAVHTPADAGRATP